MKHFKILILLTVLLNFSCKTEPKNTAENQPNTVKNSHIREQIDTVGFAQYGWQMDSIFNRISSGDKQQNDAIYKAAICPHDDYTYAGGLYAKTLSGIKAKTILLIGVAHGARNFDLKDKLVFGTFDAWKAPAGTIKVSALRNQIMAKMPKNSLVVHDSMMQQEHSLEAIIPFLQRKNPQTEIIPILVPYMRFEDMQQFAAPLAQVLHELMKENNLGYGKDVAIVISNDAIHYGDEDWGGSDMAPFGTDERGTAEVKAKEMEIVTHILSDTLSTNKIEKFNKITVKPEDYMQYNWTWCGRYSVPFGLLVANSLNSLENNKPLVGTFIDYRSSLDLPHLEVSDLGMGTTAPANNHHWVGYVGIGYE